VASRRMSFYIVQGVENPAADHTQGISLLSSQEQPFVFVASWDTAAIVDGQMTVTFGTESYKTETMILDENYNPLPNQRDALAAQRAVLLHALNGMREFTK
jgi:membrane-anchored protein YejM (alkaline phosphatase superfamily)